MASRFYQWTIHWAHTRFSSWALAIIAFAESSFFPIPPDPFMMILTVFRPKRWWWYALLTTVASVLGAIAAYFIGLVFYETVGKSIIDAYHLTDAMREIGERYRANAFLAIIGAALTPIPYKVFTIAAGLFHVPLGILIVASIVGRGARFFVISYIMYTFGSHMEEFIKKYFNLLSALFFALLIAGFIVIKYLL